MSQEAYEGYFQKYGDIDAQHLKELKELQEENSRLKQMFADLSLNHRILMILLKKALKDL